VATIALYGYLRDSVSTGLNAELLNVSAEPVAPGAGSEPCEEEKSIAVRFDIPSL